MLTGLGRRLIDSCMYCQDFGIERISDGTITAKCDRGDVTGCMEEFNTSEVSYRYF